MRNFFLKKNKVVSEKLLESEMRYRRLFESAKDGILILNFETGEIVDANPFIVKIIGNPLHEVLGKKLWEIGLFSNKEESKQAFDELKETSYIRFEDMPILKRNGTITDVEFISNVYLVNNIKVIQCNIRNITERVNAEKALKESEEKFRSIMENSADAIFITDQTGKYIYTNKAVTDLLGFSAEEMLLKTISDLAPKNKIESYFKYFNEIQHTGKLFTEIELFTKAGDYLAVDLNSVLLPDGSTYGSCRDITYRKQAEKALMQSQQSLKKQNADYFDLNKEYAALNEELTDSLNRIQNINLELNIAKNRAEESDNLKTAFLANMSHEIRTPINAIMGFSDILLQPNLTKQKHEDFIQIINASSLQLLSIISDIIDISKIEAGQITIFVELVNINNLIHDLFISYNKLVQIKKLKLLVLPDQSNDLIQIMTDGNKIKQVFCNLLNNAIKFTKEGSIEFGYQIKGDFIEFHVKDTGIGIAPENLQLIFQRFRQVENTNTRMYGGNGLGLSISKALIEKLGGTFNVKSEIDKGSVFTFSVPYSTKPENTESAVKMNEQIQVADWNEKTILLVEDEANNHAYIDELLAFTHIKILHAWDGEEAVELVKNHAEISLVLMDIKMPIMDGYEATRIIKQIRPKLPVIAQTAYALSHEKKQAFEAGCDDYLVKPVGKNVFMHIISSYFK